MKKIKYTTQDRPETSISDLIKSSLLFGVIFWLIALTLLTTFSLIFIKKEDSTKYISLCGKLSLYISTFLSSFFFSRKSVHSPFLCGILFGGVITGMIFISSLFYPSSSESSIIWILILPLVAILSAFIGKKRKLSTHRHRKKRRK